MNPSEAPPTLPAELSAILAASLLGTTPLAWLPAREIPPPYQQLLVHDHDMTSELAGFHQDSIALAVLQSRQTGNLYFREVILHAAATGAPVEYGLIEILLDSFPADLRPLILAGETPLGTILTTSGLDFRSAPQGFFAIPAEVLRAVFPQSPTGAKLFGRYNYLVCGESTCLARILEILPPLDS
jgi:chorismate-pyruvate lyase